MSKELLPHQQRVVDERVELMDKVEKLFSFFNNPIFDKLDVEDQSLLKQQEVVMKAYADILHKRISRF